MLCFCWWSTRSQLLVIDNINAQRLSAPKVPKLMVYLTGSIGKPIKGMSGSMTSITVNGDAMSNINNNTNITG